MEEENDTELLQRFRRDRRILLNFILSGSLIKKVVMPPGAVSLDDVDLDQVSVDFVLNCARKGGLLELSEAIRDYHDSTLFPHMSNAGSTDEFFLATNPELSGSPPRRLPPLVPVATPLPNLATLSTSESVDTEPFEEPSSLSKSMSLNSTQQQELTVDDIEDFDDFDDLDEVDNRRYSRRVLNDASDLVLGLPSFATGVGDDDLRETAYEILLAAAGASGGLIVPSKDKKKEKKSILMRKLGRSKSENVMTQSQHLSGLVSLLETMRVQMEISEAMDVRTRLGLLNAMIGKVGKRMDTILIPLELLCCISRTEFSDKKSYIKWQKRQLNMLEEGLINYPAVGFGESGRKANELRVLLAKIEESESFPPPAAELQRTECLKSLREIANPLAERPARGDLTGEVCHWADGYHLNVKLYEKLLLSVFDVLDEGKLTEEVEEILELLKSTWRILGITETIHYTCYAWVLFRQFVITGEQRILQYVIEQLKKIPLKEQRGPQERMHLKSLHSRVEIEKGFQELTFLQSFLLPISKWADKQLGDYHLNYAEGSAMMENTVAVAMLVRRLLLEEPETAMEYATISDTEQIEFYVTSSIKNAFTRMIQDVEAIAHATNEHPLALLAEHTKKLLQRDNAIYMPILSQRHRKAAAVSASILHKLYGIKLRPFLENAEHLTEDTIAVFPAADSLEQYIMQVIVSTCADGTSDAYCRKLNLFKIETVSGTLVLRWVNSQLARILNWVDRAIQQERWTPVSPQQRHGSSIVEVYRIVEETVDQFFALKVPMRPGELGSLFRGIDNAFQVYAKTILDKIANKEDVVPPVPILTRYSREHGIKAFVKKELKDTRIPDVLKSVEIDVVATSTLCVQLNSLHYAISQLNKLEDSIWERWTRKKHHDKSIKSPAEETARNLQKDSFDGSRKDINAAIDRMCEFTGTKIIFWDLREPFIENLYKPSVSQSRLESVMDPLDMVLNQLCDVIMEPLRDRVVTGLLQASLDGLLRVILDGGPSRVFSLGDAKLLEEDLEILKEFFISGGDGLPRGVVENQVARVRQVVKLHGYETREIIEDLRSASELEMQGGRGKLGADTKTLLRILCHRGESEASQFVKKQFKIPKSGA
ncbi:protein unc-13 homolog isoform X1 [Nicotiana tomentosiformis]|uniref:protein unc-13 homolog isoform X1 n=2 Tax=Nicotiana tomentosiformis TaxID=4098 RepID=UPI00051AEF54|nr:protein unc-13 homolog isoform X1 [Nicotiana tomentosiformis]XP_018628023.1 protein unc-13 homolog isoform X1 [Nicotiana tomentosiformis]